jgi:hypothetical protein
MRKAIVSAVIAIVMITVFAADSHADKRSYIWTYEYMTMLKGRFELEYGITDHWDISMYQMLKQSNTAKSDKFEYEGGLSLEPGTEYSRRTNCPWTPYCTSSI